MLAPPPGAWGGGHFPAAREPFAAADCARAGKPVCAVRPPGFFAPADCTREAACGVIDVRRAPVPLLLPLLFPMPIASSALSSQ
ncbi:hypothetical protein BB341_29200 (plasmid) [Streptomyces clavuligerus]|uniref:Uncharacterized protein n=1 Tax=Streptomyces clavuligerus TaxID=1901 RepID=B5GMJ8_STRCL|nr:hypothetical protein BB341_29200 [Streptomyces clavuligerus]EDY47544.1 hypothetical protein SSCG_00572 [Streptomyces clavuligerus]EFG04503.1 Hypothetical protein SCLAV_p1016 [Streptomyces clavuligerus]